MLDFFSKKTPEEPQQEDGEPELALIPWLCIVIAVWAGNSLAFMICWNYVMPYVCDASKINFLQAGALYVLKNIIFYKKMDHSTKESDDT